MKQGLLVAVSLLLAGHVRAGQERPPTPIAVLDFANRNPGDGRDWLGKGLADMVITDLSASDKLAVVDRRRMQDVVKECELAAAGHVGDKAAPQIAQLAKVRWVLFGTFLCQGDRVSIEALLIDATTQETLRIEQVEGRMGEVFDLEQGLMAAVLKKLQTPMTEHELRLVKLLKTQSLPAFEHYSESLAWFDKGQWHDALREAREAQRADPSYLVASIRVAQLYHEMGEPEHAMLEYRRLADFDREEKLPDEFYFRMARVLDEALKDRVSATLICERILRRYKELDKPFRIADPSRPSHAWDEVGGIAGVRKIVEQYLIWSSTLARLGRWQAEAGHAFEAAQLFSRIRHFACTHGMPLGDGGAFSSLSGEVAYGGLYWQLVLENRDATLYPPGEMHVLAPSKEPPEGGTPNTETVGPDTAPTHGYYKWLMSRVWLAPPDREIAQVRFALDPPADPSKLINGKAQTDFICAGFPSILRKMIQEKPDGTWHTLELPPGIRSLQTHVFVAEHWKMEFTLRPWSKDKMAIVPNTGGFQVNVLPENGELYINGQHKYHITSGIAFLDMPVGAYAVEVRWPDGRSRSGTVVVERGKRSNLLLNAGSEVVSRQVLARRGSHTQLMADHAGRFWLLWDDAMSSDGDRAPNPESDLYLATSTDGTTWTPPRRLTVSSQGRDEQPALQQDGRGTYWLAWVSDRDPQAPKGLWIASSSDGADWSFPRKIILPEAQKDDVARWRSSGYAQFGFAIDPRGVFWLVWQGWLLRSEDAQSWKADTVLRTGGEMATDNYRGSHYHLTCDHEGRLLLVSKFWANDKSKSGPKLWRRSAAGEWALLGHLCEPPGFGWHSGFAAPQRDGTILTVTLETKGLCVRRFGAGGPEPETWCVEPYLGQPFHPSIAALPDGRVLVAFASRDGIVAAVLRRDPAVEKKR